MSSALLSSFLLVACVAHCCGVLRKCPGEISEKKIALRGFHRFECSDVDGTLCFYLARKNKGLKSFYNAESLCSNVGGRLLELRSHAHAVCYGNNRPVNDPPRWLNLVEVYNNNCPNGRCKDLIKNFQWNSEVRSHGVDDAGSCPTSGNRRQCTVDNPRTWEDTCEKRNCCGNEDACFLPRHQLDDKFSLFVEDASINASNGRRACGFVYGANNMPKTVKWGITDCMQGYVADSGTRSNLEIACVFGMKMRTVVPPPPTTKSTTITTIGATKSATTTSVTSSMAISTASTTTAEANDVTSGAETTKFSPVTTPESRMTFITTDTKTPVTTQSTASSITHIITTITTPTVHHEDTTPSHRPQSTSRDIKLTTTQSTTTTWPSDLLLDKDITEFKVIGFRVLEWLLMVTTIVTCSGLLLWTYRLLFIMNNPKKTKVTPV